MEIADAPPGLSLSPSYPGQYQQLMWMDFQERQCLWIPLFPGGCTPLTCLLFVRRRKRRVLEFLVSVEALQSCGRHTLFEVSGSEKHHGNKRQHK